MSSMTLTPLTQQVNENDQQNLSESSRKAELVRMSHDCTTNPGAMGSTQLFSTHHMQMGRLHQASSS
jgi:hypothetical protein